MNRTDFLRAAADAACSHSPSYSVSYQGHNYIPHAYQLSYRGRDIVHTAVLIGKDNTLMYVPLAMVNPEIKQKGKSEEEKEAEKAEKERAKLARNLFPEAPVPDGAFLYKEFHFVPAFVFDNREEERKKKNLASFHMYLKFDAELGYFPLGFSNSSVRYGIYEAEEFYTCAGMKLPVWPKVVAIHTDMMLSEREKVIEQNKKEEEREYQVFYCVERGMYYYAGKKFLLRYIGPTEFRDGFGSGFAGISV